MKAILLKGANILAHGFIFFALSERFFWAFWRPGQDTTSSIVVGILSYSLLAYTFLFLVDRFKISGERTLLIAACAYSFLAESVLSGMIYSPQFLLVIAIAIPWHALVTILFGWYFLPRLLMKSLPQIIATLIGLGTLFSYWAVGWFSLPGHELLSLENFIVHAFATTLLLIGGYVLKGYLHSKAVFQYSSQEGWVLFFIGVAIIIFPPLYPAPLVLSAPVAALAFWIFFMLFRTAQSIETIESAAPTQLSATLPLSRLLLLLVIPITASGIMSLVPIFQWHTKTYLPIAALLTGFFLYQCVRLFQTLHPSK